MVATVASPDLRTDTAGFPFDESPLLVFFEVTQACDLACLHCRACAQATPHPSELSTDESLALIDQLATFPKPPTLILTGGDPFKRYDLFTLIEHAVLQGLEVSITPSATALVTPQGLWQLKRVGISRLAVSLDGPDAHSHDRVRGVTGSYQRTLEILRDAADCGIPTQVNTTLTPDNVDQIDAMAEMLGPLNISLWSIFFLVPVGRAAGQPQLTANECESAFATIWQQSRRQAYTIKTTEAPHYRRYVLQHSKHAPTDEGCHSAQRWVRGVNAGNGVMFISHAGLIHPSGFLPVVCGVFPLDHVVRVYQSSAIFRGLRDADRLEGKCRECEFRRLCGGSRARAYAVTGNLFAEEPDCCYAPSRLKAIMEPKHDVPNVITRSTEEFFDEHARLTRLIRELGAVIHGRRVRQADVRRKVRQFCQCLLAHFQFEERGGYFKEALAIAPRLQGLADRLSAEHREFSERARELNEHAAIRDGGELWWEQMGNLYDSLVTDLRAHERAENHLIQAAYLVDIGAED